MLQHALLDDHSPVREHIMQRAAVALGLAFGRNPSNYCLLREEDLKNALAGHRLHSDIGAVPICQARIALTAKIRRQPDRLERSINGPLLMSCQGCQIKWWLQTRRYVRGPGRHVHQDDVKSDSQPFLRTTFCLRFRSHTPG